MRNPQDFFSAASKIGYTFNWFYTDNQKLTLADVINAMGIAGTQDLRGRRPDVLGLGPVPCDRRHHAAADRVGEPLDAPAGGW